MQFVNSSYGYSAERHAAHAAETEATLSAAVKRSMQDNLSIICASTYGASALTLVKIAKEMGCSSQLIAVRHHPHLKGDRSGVVQLMPKEAEEELFSRRSEDRDRHSPVRRHVPGFADEIQGRRDRHRRIRHACVCSAPGMKVALECGIMAMEAGYLEYPQKVISMGGHGAGVDTAVVMTPVPSSSFFELKIHEVLCMHSE